MRTRLQLLAGLLLLSLSAAAQLAPPQQKVVEYLTSTWGKDYAVTGVDLAMAAVGGRYTDDDRLAIAEHLKQHPELHRALRAWGWETMSLTPEEKIIARRITAAERENRPAPAAAELSHFLGLSREETDRRLEMLVRLGILRRDGVRFQSAAEKYRHWEPGIHFLFHRVTMDGRRFDTF